MTVKRTTTKLLRVRHDAHVEVLLPGGESWASIGLDTWPSHEAVAYLEAREREGRPVRVAVTDQSKRSEVDAVRVEYTADVVERRDMGRHRVKARLAIHVLIPAGATP